MLELLEGENVVKQGIPVDASEGKAERNRLDHRLLLYPAAEPMHGGHGPLIIGIGSLAFAASGVKILAPHGDLGGWRLRHPALRHLAHSIAASTALFEMEDIPQTVLDCRGT
jgi:hypothetical protein